VRGLSNRPDDMTPPGNCAARMRWGVAEMTGADGRVAAVTRRFGVDGGPEALPGARNTIGGIAIPLSSHTRGRSISTAKVVRWMAQHCWLTAWWPN
jgi:hypothetical protein